MDIYVYVIILVGQLGRVKSIIVKYLGRYFHRTSTKSKKSIISNEKVGYKSLDVESGKKIGMTMLGDPYVFEAMDERMGIVTLNTPNLFDVNYSTEDTKEMCAWSLLMSSTLLYNLSGEINSNDFDQLQMFTEYAITLKEEVEEKSLRMSNASPQNLVKRVEETRKFLLDTIEKQKDEVEKEENNIQKIFKDITLLVSDWVNEEEYEYGWEGGEKYLRKQLGNKKWLHENFVSVRCFLMPRITENIMSTESNDGSLSPERKVFDMFAADIYNMKNISTIQKTADSTGKYWLEYSNTMFTVVNEKIFTSKIKTSRQEVEKDTLNWIEQQLEKDFDFCSMHDVDAVITTRINDIIAGKEILCKLSFDKQAEIFNSVMVEVNKIKNEKKEQMSLKKQNQKLLDLTVKEESHHYGAILETDTLFGTISTENKLEKVSSDHAANILEKFDKTHEFDDMSSEAREKLKSEMWLTKEDLKKINDEILEEKMIDRSTALTLSNFDKTLKSMTFNYPMEVIKTVMENTLREALEEFDRNMRSEGLERRRNLLQESIKNKLDDFTEDNNCKVEKLKRKISSILLEEYKKRIESEMKKVYIKDLEDFCEKVRIRLVKKVDCNVLAMDSGIWGVDQAIEAFRSTIKTQLEKEDKAFIRMNDDIWWWRWFSKLYYWFWPPHLEDILKNIDQFKIDITSEISDVGKPVVKSGWTDEESHQSTSPLCS